MGGACSSSENDYRLVPSDPPAADRLRPVPSDPAAADRNRPVLSDSPTPARYRPVLSAPAAPQRDECPACKFTKEEYMYAAIIQRTGFKCGDFWHTRPGNHVVPAYDTSLTMTYQRLHDHSKWPLPPLRARREKKYRLGPGNAECFECGRKRVFNLKKCPGQCSKRSSEDCLRSGHAMMHGKITCSACGADWIGCGGGWETDFSRPQQLAPYKPGEVIRRLAGMDAIATDGSLGLMTIFIALLFLLYMRFAYRQRGRASQKRTITKPLAARADSAEPKIQV